MPNRYGVRLKAGEGGGPAGVEFVDGRLRPPRDAAVELLCAAAEIEHGMLVQYLFGAYSVDTSLDDGDERRPRHRLRAGLYDLAHARLGAMMSVQRLLELVGGPPHFERDMAALDSELFPVRFRLEPISADVLAKYLLAERPEAPPPGSRGEAWEKAGELETTARRANDGVPLRPVGPLYAQLRELFATQLEDADLLVAVGPDPAATVDRLRSTAVATLGRLVNAAPARPGGPSRFETLWRLFGSATALERRGERIAHPTVTDPRTAPPRELPGSGDHPDQLVNWARESSGYLHAPRARRWGQLFNARYRMFLAHLTEYAETPHPPAGHGDRARALLGATHELRRMRLIGQKLAAIRLDPTPTGPNAGAPFELPHTLALGRTGAARRRLHLDLACVSANLAESLNAQPADRDDPFLLTLPERDAERLLAQPVATADPADFTHAARLIDAGLHDELASPAVALEYGLYLEDRSARPRTCVASANETPGSDGPAPSERETEATAPDLGPEPRDEAGLRDGSRSKFEVHPGGPFLFSESERELLRRLEGIDPDDRERLVDHGPRLLRRLRAGTLPHARAWPSARVEAFASWLVCELTDEDS